MKTIVAGMVVVALAGSAGTAWQQTASSTPSAFDGRAFGAKGDGKTLDTDAITKAKDAF